ncbi:putative ribonuclease H-like domain-containing protein [Tanacetum coccineum]|uniref:Ribonuclease H-like domain-containing protein n=1 Tax=Tanacetum coccineum TaxID=301880 RepID=A0ABQ4YP22_9ASTR
MSYYVARLQALLTCSLVPQIVMKRNKVPLHRPDSLVLHLQPKQKVTSFCSKSILDDPPGSQKVHEETNITAGTQAQKDCEFQTWGANYAIELAKLQRTRGSCWHCFCLVVVSLLAKLLLVDSVPTVVICWVVMILLPVICSAGLLPVHADVSTLPPGENLEPTCIAKALEDPDWVDAMQEEMQQFINQQVWKLVPLPDGKHAIGTKWILKNKRDARGIVVRNKARLVAQGHRQEEGIDYDEVFAPVARIEAIRLFLAFASYMGFLVLKIHTDDNVADLLTKAFDGPRFEYLVVHIGMVDMVLVSAGSTMILLVVILPAGCFVSAVVYAVNTSIYAAELVCAGSIMFLLADLFLLVVTCFCCLNLVSAVLSLILLVEAEYVAAASCCAQVLWIQNQLLDYGFNFMNTKIFIDNQSTICIVKNPVFHQRTKHIEIRHHFIRDANEKNLIQVLKIHTDDNVADLLTKAFDGPRFAYLVVHIGMVVNTAASCTFFLLTGWLLLFLLLVDSFCWLNTFMLLELFMLSIHLFMLLNWFVLFDIVGWLVSATSHLVSADSLQSCWYNNVSAE